MISSLSQQGEAWPNDVRMKEDVALRLFRICLIVGAIAFLTLLAGWLFDSRPGHTQFYFSYLWGYCWALSLTLGALFWNLIHHVSAAGWSVVLRRIWENATRLLLMLALLFIPIALGIPSIYKWSHDETLAHGKQLWLSPLFFCVRFAVYFTIWITISIRMRRWSLLCDRTDEFKERAQLLRRMEYLAPVGTLLLALSSTFAVFDLIMSLNHSWFSTIFGVIFWADSIRASLAFTVLVVLFLHQRGYLRNQVTREHFHDLGKLMFGFTVFWTYVAFSQYFLYWYGNIAEETKWYWDRRTGSWYTMSIFLPLGYFAVPFLVLLPRGNKRNPKIIGLVSGWILLFHLYHFYWEIMPEGLKANVYDRPAQGVSWHWLDLAAMLFFAALVAANMLYGFRQAALIPIQDPRLAEALHHEVDEFGDPGLYTTHPQPVSEAQKT